jgi:Glyoxalase-like domain
VNTPRLRQAVIAAVELDPVAERLREELELGEPFTDPAVAHFGLRNAVFALGDTFLEVVSPVEDGTAAGRLLDRRGGDCGYMAMFQVDDVAAARERAAAQDVREVFDVALDEITEAHLHPADIGGAIVSISEPRPPESWLWGGPRWSERATGGRITGITVAVPDPAATRRRWEAVIGGAPGVEFTDDAQGAGILAIEVERAGGGHATVRP